MRCSALRWPMTGSTADLRRSSRLIFGVTPRFWPERKTLSLWSGGALWPRYPLSARMRAMVLPAKRLHVRDHGRQGVTVIWIAGQRLHMGDELAALAVLEGGGNAHLDAELVRPMGLALADAFDFRRMQGIDLRPALMLLLLADAPRQQ